MGHLNFDNLVKTSKQEEVRGLPKMTKPISLREYYQHGNHAREKFKIKEHLSTSEPVELIHTGLCEPSRVKSLQGERYFML